MQILRVAQDIYPDTVGGAPYHIHALSRDQAANGHDVTVLTVNPDRTEPRRVERDGYTVVRQTPKVELFGNALFTNTLGYLREAAEYDVVHVHSHLFFSSNVAAVYNRFDDTPLAVTCHGLVSQRVPRWFSRLYLRTVGKWTYNAADVVFCYTDIERTRLQGLGVDSPIRVIHNGVDIDMFSPAGETHPEMSQHDGPAVLFVGRLVDGKRPRDALAAFARVHSECPDARLYICGDGPLYSDLSRSVTERGLSDSVCFLGEVPYRMMPSVYRGADVFVLPSRSEGFPRTMMESLACGTPIVSTNLEQITPIVDRVGETVEIGDIQAIATEIGRFLNDPGRVSELGATGRDIVTEKFDWSDTVETTTDALERVADGTEPAVTAGNDPEIDRIPP